MSLTVTMNAPPGLGGQFTGMPSGKVYDVPASGVLTSVNISDVSAFQQLGFQMAPNTVANTGTPGAGVTAIEYGDAYNHVTVLSLAATLGAIAGGAALALGLTIYTLPAGAQIVEGVSMSVGIQQTEGNITADTPYVGIGSVIASGAVATLAGTATFMDLLTQLAAADCDGTPTVSTKLATSSPFAFISAAAGSKAIHLNVADTWAASGDAGAGVNGTVILYWKQGVV